MAVNCCGVPAATDVEFGVTVIPVRVGVLTVALVDPWIDPLVAVIVATPGATAVAMPADVMVTAAGLSLLQET